MCCFKVQNRGFNVANTVYLHIGLVSYSQKVQNIIHLGLIHTLHAPYHSSKQCDTCNYYKPKLLLP